MSQRKLGEVCNCKNVCSAEKNNNMIYLYIYVCPSVKSYHKCVVNRFPKGSGWGRGCSASAPWLLQLCSGSACTKRSFIHFIIL